MRIIDRYLLWQFIQTFCITFISLTGLYVVIDAFGNLDEFIGYAETEGGLLSVMGKYYSYRMVAFFDRISGMLALISAMFTVTWIQRHHEMTALSAAGIPTFRIIVPVIAAATSISILAAANRELVIPQIRDHLIHNAQDWKGEQGKPVQQRYDRETDILLRGKRSFANEHRIEGPNFLLPTTLSQYGKQLVAKNAYYRPAHGSRPAGYLLDGVSQPRDLRRRPSLELGGKAAIMTCADYPWLNKSRNQCFVVSNISFDLLQSGEALRLYSSTSELIQGLSSPSLDFGNDVRVAIHGRVVQPMLDVTLLFLGLPLVLSRGNRNVFLAIGLCVALAVVFMLVVLGCQFLGASYWINPALAAWMPLAIFVPLAVGMSDPLWH